MHEKDHGFLRVALIMIGVAFAVRFFVAQPFVVNGASMSPTFVHKEYLIIDELSYFLREPERGEVVVFRYPRSPWQYFIKRIIGLPGETVEIKNGKIHIINNNELPQGSVLQEPYLASHAGETYPDLIVSLQSDEYFVLGDNRSQSSDSRVWGPLGRQFLVGRVLVRIFPFNRFSLMHAVMTDK
ncbi:MAG: signal peptidase I [Parcubacteria group bacterium Gr01-1014_66]|nr:MAG: signal peptidase I [Parcubacteria group bacterium Gr01-1014_66]